MSKKRSIHRQQEKKVKKRIFRVFGILFLCILAFGIVASVTMIIFRMRSVWNTSEVTILLFVSSQDEVNRPLTLAWLYPEENEAYILTIPPQARVQALGEYGTFRSEALDRRYEIEKKSRDFLLSTIGLRVGLIPQVYIKIPSDTTLTLYQDIHQALQNSLFHMNAGLNIYDKIQAFRFVNSLREDQVHFIQPNETLFTQKKEENDIDFQQQRNSIFRDKLSSTLGVRKNTSIAVINASEVAGVATRVGEVFENVGYTVVQVKTQEEAQAQTTFVFSQDWYEKKETFIQVVQKLFPVSLKIKKDDEIAQSQRSDIVVIVGKDFGELVY